MGRLAITAALALACAGCQSAPEPRLKAAWVTLRDALAQQLRPTEVDALEAEYLQRFGRTINQDLPQIVGQPR